METWMRAARVGVGIAGLGYGIVRLSRGKRDFITNAALATGLSVTLNGLSRGRIGSNVTDSLSHIALGALR
ncbi:MAG TPA: hypothetical protein VD902_05230 [Symbiobacteriaceae bacterium]|nr:hypothetical protein [Symbiobacteriaceae bacterium]